MKSLRLLSPLCGVATLITLLLGMTPAAHADLSFHVSLNTAPLASALSANAPFSLAFQLIDGDGVANNSATINNFTFNGGSAGGNLTTFGGATGDLGSEVTLSDPDPGFIFNAFSQEFTPGSELGFDVYLSTEFAGETPDRFSMAVLDNSGFEIPTVGLSSEFLAVDLTGPSAIVETYGAVAPYEAVGTPVVGPVAPTSSVTTPEPSALALLALVLPIIARVKRSTPV